MSSRCIVDVYHPGVKIRGHSHKRKKQTGGVLRSMEWQVHWPSRLLLSLAQLYLPLFSCSPDTSRQHSCLQGPPFIQRALRNAVFAIIKYTERNKNGRREGWYILSVIGRGVVGREALCQVWETWVKTSVYIARLWLGADIVRAIQSVVRCSCRGPSAGIGLGRRWLRGLAGDHKISAYRERAAKCSPSSAARRARLFLLSCFFFSCHTLLG